MTEPVQPIVSRLDQRFSANRMLRLFSFPAFLGALLVAGLFLTVRLNLQLTLAQPSPSQPTSIIEGDTWWHITTGERILQTHTWPTHESDSFTARGSEWIAYEWLGDVALALAERLGGLPGLAVLLLVLASAILVLTYYCAYLRSGGAEAAFLGCIVLFPLFGVSFSLRPQLFGYIFLLVTLISLEQFRAGRFKRLWLLPLVFVIWVNTHPTFIYGLALLVVYWASGQVSFAVGGLRAEAWNPEKRRHLLLVTILSLATLPLNPYGVRLPGYLLHMALDEPLNLAYIQEWRAPDFNEFYGKVFLVLLLVFLLAVLALRPRYRWEEFALLLCAAWLACLHMRFLILFAIVFAPFLAGLLVRWVQLHHAGHERYLLNGALMGMIAAGVVVFLPSRSTLDGVVRRGFPVGAVEYLRANPVNAPMFNDDSWGAFLTRSLGRQHQVFIDGRIDAYEPAGVLADYLQIVHLNNDPERLLRKYGVESCLLDPAEPFATFLANSPEWRKVYADKVSVLFVRWPHPVDIMNVSTHASTEDLGQRGSSREAGH